MSCTTAVMLQDRLNDIERNIYDGIDFRQELNEAYALADELNAENAKLRKECDHWHVEQVHAYGNWEDAHKRVIELQAENSKLREFINLKETCWKYVGWCDECPYNGIDDEHDNCICTVQENIDSLARELGIEVE